ncbi:transcriptional regulator GcvA [Noviherbaspirillum cavernae]|uniref:Transcriptional regulator GcvA n=1 Tax=Noviherbaspirillum cavernae TaxID=2320862 RepID=A0A418X3R9_9BURK|nr:transcriptional regulator GcvA [Noviherbaspirillum cavernae]RJG07099.1 transcriptional regulator GcvA [Noviherbaspirillum cavernae]
MKRYTPSLSCLQAFEAAGRYLSFTRAAQELYVTQGAVSRLIQTLENQLGVLLFVRQNKYLTLTSAGEAYLRKIQPCLARLEAATQELQAGHSGGARLNLSVLPTFSAKWLMPRFPAFAAAHPNILINISTRIAPFSFGKEDIDAAIHFGEPVWPEPAKFDFLLSESVIPVCSPDFMKRHGPFKEPRDLTRCTLLHLASRANSWQNWLEKAGAELEERVGGPMFEHYLMIFQAAVAGLGIGLVPPFLIADELNSGKLIAPFDILLSETAAYYLVYPEDRAHYSPLKLFREWLLQEIRQVHQVHHAAPREPA